MRTARRCAASSLRPRRRPRRARRRGRSRALPARRVPRADDTRRVDATGRRARSSQPFERRAPTYGAGHRGVDLAAAPGTPVRAANDGVVSFAGDGRRHAARRPSPTTAICAPRTRSSRRSACAPGRRSPGATSSALTGGAGDDHDGTRAPPRPARRRPLRRPDAALPARRPHQARAPRARGRPRRDPVVPGRRAARAAVVAAPPDARWRRRPGCDHVRRRVRRRRPAASAASSTRPATVGDWLGDRADEAVDAGLRFLDATTGLGSDGVRRALRATVRRRPSRRCARSRRSWRTPWPGHRRARSRSTSSTSVVASSTPSPPTATTTRPMPTAPEGPRTA